MMNHLLKRNLLVSNDSESSEFASSEITSDFSEYNDDSYFSKLWDIEEDIANNEAETRGFDYELQEFTYD